MSDSFWPYRLCSTRSESRVSFKIRTFTSTSALYSQGQHLPGRCSPVSPGKLMSWLNHLAETSIFIVWRPFQFFVKMPILHRIVYLHLCCIWQVVIQNIWHCIQDTRRVPFAIHFWNCSKTMLFIMLSCF